MRTYAEYCKQPNFASFGDDHKQDWLILSCGRNRDSDALAESNFASALKTLGGESETVEVFRFSHWACGWVEIIMLHPDRAKEGEAIEIKLDNYPILDEQDLGERELEEAQENWRSWRYRDMAKAIVEVFKLHETTADYLNDRDFCGVLRHVHSAIADGGEEESCAETARRIPDRGYVAAILKDCRKVRRRKMQEVFEPITAKDVSP